MSYEEKRAWIMAVVSAVAYAIYLVLVLSGAHGAPLPQVTYEPALLWTIGGSIVTAIVLTIVFGGDTTTDQRDREINRFGDAMGNSFVVIGGVAALGMSLLELDHFWIANAVYLAFVLSAVLGSVARIFAYRKGFHPW